MVGEDKWIEAAEWRLQMSSWGRQKEGFVGKKKLEAGERDERATEKHVRP